ncbi:MAG: kdc [Microbacteriaceae bacterium]|nr:kdc [Microbacteriaceae bacterium]
MEATSPNYTVADYLLDRLAGLGVDRIFGVPGDFTLGLLDHVENHPVIRWCGTANELGAGYAADGYARVRGLGVVCTTFGVGELSAINAIAGAYAEHVPVLQLVGSPTTATQAAARPTHHSLGDGDFGHTLRMTAEVTVAQAMLGAADACSEIDRVLVAMLRANQPGYLSLPADIAELATEPPTSDLGDTTPVSDPRALQDFRDAAAEFLAVRLSANGARPVVLADIFVNRVHAEPALHSFLASAGLRFGSLLWGRRVIDESDPHFIGTYIGAASDPAVRDEFESAEVLITAGVYFTDLISGFFSERLDDSRRIDLLPHSAVVAGRTFAGVELIDTLAELEALLPDPGHPTPVAGAAWGAVEVTPTDEPLTQRDLWRIVAAALRPGDTVLADQGTSFYGIGPHRLPHDCVFVGQPLWASIGYTLPALLGAGLAAPLRRPVLLIGDGAAQLTIAELGTLIAEQVPAVVVIVNNAGYTVERAIHGPTSPYNDIAPWDWTAFLPAMGGTDATTQAFRATTGAEVAAAFASAENRPDVLTLIEVVTGPLDVPPLLVAVAQAAAAANAPHV